MTEMDEAPITSPSQQPYSSPEAQQMVEKDIVKQMSKILGKASQQSIKTMMDGVKGKRYDAFDLQQSYYQSGPVRDTSTGERDFMRVLWNKVRDGHYRLILLKNKKIKIVYIYMYRINSFYKKCFINKNQVLLVN